MNRCLSCQVFDLHSTLLKVVEGKVQGEHFEKRLWSGARSPLTPTATPDAKGGVERSSSWLTCPSAAASHGWPALSGRPCSLLSTVWLSSSQSNMLLATAVCIPTERALEKTHARTHTHCFHTWHTFSCKHNPSVSLSLSYAYILFKSHPHTEPLSGFHTQHTFRQTVLSTNTHTHIMNNNGCVPSKVENKNSFLSFTFEEVLRFWIQLRLMQKQIQNK